MSYSEKYRVMDQNGLSKYLCYEHKYNPDLNEGKGGYEDVIALRTPGDFQ